MTVAPIGPWVGALPTQPACKFQEPNGVDTIVMKHPESGLSALASPPKSGPDEVVRQPEQGLDGREILPPPVEGGVCLLTSPSIGLSHSDDGYRYMSKPKNQNRTFHLLQKADILTCYEQMRFCWKNGRSEERPCCCAAT